MAMFSDQLRKIISGSELTQRRACVLSGISPGNLSAFMAGRRGLGLEAIDALCDVYGVTIKHNAKQVAKLAAATPKPGRPKVKG